MRLHWRYHGVEIYGEVSDAAEGSNTSDDCVTVNL